MDRKKLHSSVDWKALAAKEGRDVARALYGICMGVVMSPEELEQERQRFEMEDWQVQHAIETLKAEIDKQLSRGAA